MYMKAITLGLAAALAFSAAPAMAAAPVSFVITADSENGQVTPTIVSSYSNFFGGDRINVQTVLRNEVYTFENYRYTYRYADTTYDRQGTYDEMTFWSIDYETEAQVKNFIHFKATATIKPDADQTLPVDVRLWTNVKGTYTSSMDPRFPNVVLRPADVTFALANSKELADLTNVKGYQSFELDGTFNAFNFSDIVVPAAGSADVGMLAYLPAQLQGTAFTFSLSTANTGLHHFSESTYLGYDVQAVPEPTTWAMLLAGVGILGVARRRKTAA